MKWFKNLFNRKPEYSEFDTWISTTLNVPVVTLSIHKYYIKHGVWYCHEHFYSDNRTIVDHISDLNIEWNTHEIRNATPYEIEYYQKHV